MRKQDVKPGVVYACRQPVSNEVVPIVFLSNYHWIGALRQDARGYGNRAFKHAHSVMRKPQAGTVHNDGTIGYPAVIVPLSDSKPSPEQVAKLLTLRLADFDAAREAVCGDDEYEFVLVTSMARVVGEWEG